mgnify:CR=1 FL=1
MLSRNCFDKLLINSDLSQVHFHSHISLFSHPHGNETRPFIRIHANFLPPNALPLSVNIRRDCTCSILSVVITHKTNFTWLQCDKTKICENKKIKNLSRNLNKRGISARISDYRKVRGSSAHYQELSKLVKK